MRGISERFRDEFLMIKHYTNLHLLYLQMEHRDLSLVLSVMTKGLDVELGWAQGIMY